jgi:enoyl-CoA hydratase/carnithine racemase
VKRIEVVQVERHHDVALLVLNRPDTRNAVNAAMAKAIVDAIASSQDAHAIVLTGTDPAFCAGLDLRDVGVESLIDLPPFNAAVAGSEVPLIAAVNGAAVTGGLELALSCDFIVASDRARFADTHLRVGVYPGPVLVELPRRVGMARAREMTLTGNFVDAATALRIGLANHVVPHDDLLAFALEFARAIAEVDPVMVREARRDWDATDRLPRADAHRQHQAHAATCGFTQASAATLAAHRDGVMARAHRQFDTASAPDAEKP